MLQIMLLSIEKGVVINCDRKCEHLEKMDTFLEK